MGNLMVSLRNAAESMRVFQRGMGVVESNVSNASTPGYARQTQVLSAMRFDLDTGLPGGVESGGTLDSRSGFAEAAVRRQLQSLGEADERTQQLERLEPVFSIEDGTGVAGALNSLFQAFSTLGVTPNDSSARQVALDRASALVRAFQATSSGLDDAGTRADTGLNQQAETINDLAGRIQKINQEFRNDYRAQNDAGLQATLNNLLEQLSEVADYTAVQAGDGSVAIYLGGQTLLTMGDRLYPVQADTTGAQARLLDSQGNDITEQISRGRLRALLDLRNSTLPARASELDTLAKTVADRVNGTLAGGVDLDGNAPVRDLFTYDSTLGVARTLGTNALDPPELALADPTAPGGNANALRLAALAQVKTIGGYSFTEYYGSIAASVGRDLEGAREAQSAQSDLASQARQLRDDLQKVSLDEEAVMLIQYQRSFEASARLVTALDEMTQVVFDMIR
jgi:flagellar hook-associated protein 1 FlgK